MSEMQKGHQYRILTPLRQLGKVYDRGKIIKNPTKLQYQNQYKNRGRVNE